MDNAPLATGEQDSSTTRVLDSRMIEEKGYRKLVDDAFAQIDRAFADVDPDQAECQYLQGTLTVSMAGKRLIVSPQPPVQQIWVAFRDRGWHLDLQPETGAWMDDRGQGIELFALIESLVLDAVGVRVQVRST